MSHTKTELQCQLEQLTRRSIELSLRSHSRIFARVHKLTWCTARVCLHPLFLTAPSEIVRALAAFVLGDRRQIAHLKNYMFLTGRHHRSLPSLSLQSAGDHHDLSELLMRVCESYFPDIAPFSVTWFVSCRPARRTVTLGLFDPISRLIKIHRGLDSPRVPSLFVRFVLYHEVLHSLHDPQIDGKNRFLIHTLPFKKAERQFAGYRECRVWQREHLWSALQEGTAKASASS